MRDFQNWPKDVPKEFYWQAMEWYHRQQVRELKAVKAYHRGIDKLKADFGAEFSEIVGKDRLKTYRKLHAARINKLRNAPSPGVAKAALAKENQRRHLVKESGIALKKSGVDLDTVKKLRTDFGEKAARLYDRTLGKGKKGKAVPRPKNIDYFPPYLLDERFYDYYKSEGGLPNPVVNRYFNGGTGDFGSNSYIHVSGADEWDLVSATIRTGFMFIYRTDRAGQPALNIDLETVGLRYNGTIREECGYSTASVRQRARIFGQVYHASSTPERTYCPVDLFYRHMSTRNDDANWSESVLSPGHDWNVSFILATPVPADTFILVCVGIETYNNFLSNDSEIHSTVEARFLARRVGITITD